MNLTTGIPPYQERSSARKQVLTMLKSQTEIGSYLKEVRENSKPRITQEYVAEVIGCCTGQIKRMEKGKNCNLKHICKYAEVLGLNPIEVLFEPEDVAEYNVPRHCDKEILELWNSLNIDVSTRLLVKDILKLISERSNKKKSSLY